MGEALTQQLRADFPRLAFKEPTPYQTCGECGGEGEWDCGEILWSVKFFKCHECRRVWVEV
jgi:hypothetical protein